jgi:hypothetical protein
MSRRMSIGLASALLLILFLPLAEAQAEGPGKACRSLIVGGYLGTTTDSDGSFAGRSLLTFHSDGAVDVIDSDQFSGVIDSAFSAQKGRYHCTGRQSVSAYTLDFGFSGDGDIGRADFRIIIEPDGTLSGGFALTILTPLVTCNPFVAGTCDVEAEFEFSFTAVPMPDQAL